uniref:F-box domain-containing protein n=1 Tax=Steinernema glaseri TaxID=37863 RepID=A0A1I7YJL0_9BILA
MAHQMSPSLLKVIERVPRTYTQKSYGVISYDLGYYLAVPRFTMKHMPNELVDKIVSYLPRPDVVNVAKVAAGRAGLKNWNAVAKYHLERRFLLDIEVGVLEKEGKEGEKTPRILLCVWKCLSDEDLPRWDFTQWQHAWIRSLSIRTKFFRRHRNKECVPHRLEECDIDQVLRLVALPVDPSAQGKLDVYYHDRPSPAFHDIFWKILGKTQKLFANVKVGAWEGNSAVGHVEDFTIDYIDRGVFLQELSFFFGTPHAKVVAAVASLFGKTRGRPLEVRCDRLEGEEITLIVDTWLESDGTFEEKEVYAFGTLHGRHKFGIWDAIKDKYEAIVKDSDHRGHLPHPSRRSSLFFSYDRIEHAPVDVDLEWIDSLELLFGELTV